MKIIKHVLGISLAAALMLAGCQNSQPPSSPQAAPDDKAESQELLSWDDNVLSGLSWEDLGLTVSVPAGELLDPNYPQRQDPIWAFWTDYPAQLALKGNTGVLIINRYATLAFDPIPIVYLQAFPLEELGEEGRFLKVGDELIPCQAAAPYEVYRDEEIAVFNLTQFVLTDPFPSYLEPYAEDGQSNQWIEEAHEKYMAEIGTYIQGGAKS